MTDINIGIIRRFCDGLPVESDLEGSLRTLLAIVLNDKSFQRKMPVKFAIETVKTFRASLKAGCSLDIAITELLDEFEKKHKEMEEHRNGNRG